MSRSSQPPAGETPSLPLPENPERSREESHHRSNNMTKSTGEGEKSSHPVPRKRLHYYLDDLLLKNGSKREAALESVVKALTTSNLTLDLSFLESNPATFLYRCLNRMKKGSAKELHSASQVIGLLAMLIDDVDNANEIYRETLPVASKVLKSRPKALMVFNCLALATFFGTTNSDETQVAMQTFWTLIHGESGSDVKAKGHLPEVRVAAISAWNFLLTSLQGWSISLKFWQGAVSYFSNLLEDDDQLVSVAAGVGLALIFEKDSVNKFCSEEEQSCGESSRSEKYSRIKESVQDGVIEKLERLCLKPRIEHVRILNYFKSGCCPEISVTFGRDTLVLPSWSKIVQLNYLKSFLGDRALSVHMKENEKLQAVFGFTPTKKYVPHVELYEPTVDEVTITCYMPKERDLTSLLSEGIKADKNMRSSIFDKAKTQIRNKNRKLAEERKNTFYCD